MSATDARRHLDRTLSSLAAEYGDIEVIRERREVEPDVYDRLRERSAAFDGPGGAGAWVRDAEGRVLLVETDEGWAEPAATRRPGQEYVECAETAVRDCGVDAALTGISHVHVRYLTDWTDRDPLPQPFAVFSARASGTPDGSAAWHATLPEDLLYAYLQELPLAES